MKETYAAILNMGTSLLSPPERWGSGDEQITWKIKDKKTQRSSRRWLLRTTGIIMEVGVEVGVATMGASGICLNER